MRRHVAGFVLGAAAVVLSLGPAAPDATVRGADDGASAGLQATSPGDDARAFGTDPNIPPTKRKAMLRWLADRQYVAGFTAEPEVHASAGPHGGNVRTFFNPILVEDLRGGRTTFRKGAAMVKELYFGSSDTLSGYAVMVKVKKNAGSSGQGWLFMESFNGMNADFFGRGIGVCANCHGGGTDYLLSEFRP